MPVIEAAEGDRTGDNLGLAVGDSPAAHAEVADTTKLTAAIVKRQFIGDPLYPRKTPQPNHPFGLTTGRPPSVP
ncbi:MAG: hypothetical protein QOI76_2818 [Frankiales bacterium]|nr:hypothetical protein [Frankiales bacterium]